MYPIKRAVASALISYRPRMPPVQRGLPPAVEKESFGDAIANYLAEWGCRSIQTLGPNGIFTTFELPEADMLKLPHFSGKYFFRTSLY
jgi:hypothetical protein